MLRAGCLVLSKASAAVLQLCKSESVAGKWWEGSKLERKTPLFCKRTLTIQICVKERCFTQNKQVNSLVFLSKQSYVTTCEKMLKLVSVSMEGKWCNPLDSPVLLWAAVIGSIMSCTWIVRKDFLRDKDLDLPCSTIPVLPGGCHVFLWKVYQRTSLYLSSEWGRQQLYPRSYHCTLCTSLLLHGCGTCVVKQEDKKGLISDILHVKQQGK